MIEVFANNGSIQISNITENQGINETLKSVIKDHLPIVPKTYTKVEGTIINSFEGLAINVEFLNAEKGALGVALIDELGEYLSLDIIDKSKKKIEFQMPVSKDQIERTKKVTLLVAKQFEKENVSEVRVYELKIINSDPPIIACKGIEKLKYKI